MKKNILPRPFIDETLIHPFREMSDVLSLSCVISDAWSAIKPCAMI